MIVNRYLHIRYGGYTCFLLLRQFVSGSLPVVTFKSPALLSVPGRGLLAKIATCISFHNLPPELLFVLLLVLVPREAIFK